MELLIKDFQSTDLRERERVLLSVAKKQLFVVSQIVDVSTWNELSPAFYKKSQLPAFRDASVLIDKRDVDVTTRSNHDFIVSIQFVIILQRRREKDERFPVSLTLDGGFSDVYAKMLVFFASHFLQARDPLESHYPREVDCLQDAFLRLASSEFAKEKSIYMDVPERVYVKDRIEYHTTRQRGTLSKYLEILSRIATRQRELSRENEMASLYRYMLPIIQRQLGEILLEGEKWIFKNQSTASLYKGASYKDASLNKRALGLDALEQLGKDPEYNVCYPARRIFADSSEKVYRSRLAKFAYLAASGSFNCDAYVFEPENAPEYLAFFFSVKKSSMRFYRDKDSYEIKQRFKRDIASTLSRFSFSYRGIWTEHEIDVGIEEVAGIPIQQKEIWVDKGSIFVLDSRIDDAKEAIKTAKGTTYGKKALANPAGIEASILDKMLKKDAPRGGY